jgi:DNA gyrase subunit A
VVKKTSFDEYDNGRRDGLIALNLREHDELVRVIETSGSDDIFMVSKSGMTIRFNESEVRPMGRAASGVRGMKMKAGDTVVSSDLAKDDVSILMITEAGFGKRVQLDKFNVQGRGGQGVKGMKFVRNKGTAVVAAFMVGDDDEIVAVASGGTTIRTPVRGIRHIGRDATGVTIMGVPDGEVVASVALILATDDDDE